MLNVLRDNLKNLKWVLWLVAFALVAYLGTYFSCERERGDLTSDWAAKVNGTPISRVMFLSEARRVEERYRQMFGDQYEQLKPSLQLGRQVIQSMIDQQIIIQEAEKLGIVASPSEIARAIRQDPSLKGPDGQFVGAEQYKKIADRNWQGGVASYEALLAQNIVMRKWADVVTHSIRVDPEEVLQAYREANDRTEVDYVVVASAEQSVDEYVSTDQIEDWYEAHRENYRIEEGRKIRFLIVDRQAQLSRTEVTDEEVRDFYQDHQFDFSHPEQRRARHILFRVNAEAPAEEKERIRARAEETLNQLKQGAGFEELAGKLSEDPVSASRGGDLGFFGRGRMVEQFEQAVFQTEVGSLAPVTETGFGFHVIQVTDERPGGTQPLEDVRDDIFRQLQQQKAEELVGTEASRLSDQIASAEALDAVAESEGLQVEERVVRRQDRLADLGPSPAFMDAVFSLEPGSVSEPVGLRAGRAILAVTEIVPSSLAPLADVEGQVVADVLNERTRTVARQVAERAFRSAGSLKGAARSLGLEIRQSGNVTKARSLPGTGGMSPELEQALFAPDSEQGDSGFAPVPAGAILYEITKREPFDLEQFESSKEEITASFVEQRRAALLQAILEKVRLGYEISVNEPLIERVNS
jgi:peptidyl-prolyl cis-trans isomerase D